MEEERVIIPLFGMMIPIIITIGAFVMVVYIRKFENMEKMAIIDKGLDPSLFKSAKSWPTSGALRSGMLLIGAGMGLLMGYWLDRAFHMDEVGYFSMLFIFGGLGLILSYLIEERKLKEHPDGR